MDCSNFYPFQKLDPEAIFTKQERIGRGSFGEVFKGIDNRNGEVSFFSFFTSLTNR